MTAGAGTMVQKPVTKSSRNSRKGEKNKKNAVICEFGDGEGRSNTKIQGSKKGKHKGEHGRLREHAGY